jgi:hypothetical protein
MVKAEELIRLQIGLEYRVEGDRLIPFPGSTEQARFIVYRSASGFVRYYQIDIPMELHLELEGIEAEQLFEDPEPVRRVLNAYSLCVSLGLFESCSFAHLPEASSYPDVVQESKTFMVRIDGQPACWAWSERSNDRCAEVAVETRPEFRRRGYAQQAVSALVASEMASGKVVFYSYKMENLASRELGRRLGVVPFAVCMAFD